MQSAKALAAQALSPELVALHRLPARAPLLSHDRADSARYDADSRWRLSLDGSWNFRLLERPEAVPPKWPTDSIVMARQWNTVNVPGCWTRQRVGDYPHYTNIIMPWPSLEAPETPERNPTGLYHRVFDVPESWIGRDIVVHLGGFESVAMVWCNGTFVGMGKDSRLPSEFDLSSSVVAGRNRLDVMVVRYSDATWIEDQDHWWHAGLHRSVFIEARPVFRVDDVSTMADFDPQTGTGTLHVDAHMCGKGGGHTIRASLYDGDQEIATSTGPVPTVPDGSALNQLARAYDYPGRVVSLDLHAGKVDPWTAETPRLYRVVVELIDSSSQTQNAVALNVGFRRIEVRDRRFLVNGVPVVMLGVNRHDHHPETGKVQTVDELRDDLLSMKRNNFNAVRCAHYPNDHRLLDLCDELGMYVIDEANIESHARLRSVADDTRYLPAFLDRVKRMVLRDRNHACVVMWSLGNESGHGAAHDACAGWVRAVDPSRPLHYEGALQRRFNVNSEDLSTMLQPPSTRERLVTDIVCPMYTATDKVVAWAQWAEASGEDDRPLILCEYSHAMGNSNGSVAAYAQAFFDEPALAGGFIWDWRDQGLNEIDERGRPYWAYGGHFGDVPNDANFCINGLVGPDGSPHPGLVEVAWAYRPVTVTAVRGRRVRITNRRAFSSIADLEAHWSLVVNGHAVEEGSLKLDLDANSTKTLSIPFETELERGVDARLHLCWRQTSDTAWAEAGHLVAWDEIELRTPKPSTVDHGMVAGTAIVGGGAVRAGRTELSWDQSGPLAMAIDGIDVEVRAFAPTLWRAPTDNDGVSQGWMSEVSGVRPQWLQWGLDSLTIVPAGAERFELHDGRTAICFHRNLVGPTTQAEAVTRFIVGADSIEVEESMQIPDEWSDLPRVGTRFEIAARFDRLAWFGAGPHETYPDRKASGLNGIWQSRVGEQYHPFVVPQEHGAHADTRWFSLTDRHGKGLRVATREPSSFSARFEHDAMLSDATTIAQIEQADTIEVHVDAAVRGLGTGACGPDSLPEFRVGSGHYAWAMTLHAERP